MKLHAHIISDFPESMEGYLNTSIMRIAQEKDIFHTTFYKISNYSNKPTKRIDDRPYGGGAGTLIQIEPLYVAIMDIHDSLPDNIDIIHIYLGPRGETLKQDILQEFVDTNITTREATHIIFVCGHYEGVDGRLFDIFDFTIYSLGDFIVSSGEIATLTFLDSIVRLIPGVVGNPDSIQEESFGPELDGKKEFLQYSRPAEFKGYKVPDVLTSGDHAKIQEWKKTNLQ